MDPRGARVFAALGTHLPLLGESLQYQTHRYEGSYSGRHFAAGGVTLQIEPYDLSVVFTLGLHSHDVYVTITEGPVADVANVLCDLDAYSATEARLGERATFAPDNPLLRAAGHDGVVIVDLDFWRPFKGVEPDLMLAEEDCLHLHGCFFITKAERALRLERGFDAMWDHFAENDKDPYAWPASSRCGG